MKNPIIMHINYCEQGQTFDEVCQKAAAWGFDGIEFRSGDMYTGLSDAEYLQKLADAIRRNDVKTYILGYPGADISIEDKDRAMKNAVAYNEKLSLIARYLKPLRINFFAGKVLGANNDGNLFDENGSIAATEAIYENTIAAGRCIAEHAATLCFTVCMETHMNYLHDQPEAVLRIVEGVDHPNFKVLFDYGNMLYLKIRKPLKESFELLKDHIQYVHLKNSATLPDNVRFPTSLGEGEINHREYVRLLAEYEGPIAIEAPREGDREYFAQCDLQYIRTLLPGTK